MTPTQDNHLTVPEAAARAGVSEATIWRWIKAGLLTRFKRGRNRTVVDPEQLDAVLRPRPETPEPPKTEHRDTA